ncbi:hypothetical protein VCV18_005655 [Metarhizium anisopliae]
MSAFWDSMSPAGGACRWTKEEAQLGDSPSLNIERRCKIPPGGPASTCFIATWSARTNLPKRWASSPTHPARPSNPPPIDDTHPKKPVPIEA